MPGPKNSTNFSTTFFASSEDAKLHIINFIRGVLSFNPEDIRNAMFTPFFPCTLQEAFSIKEFSFEDVCKKIPAYKRLRGSIKTVEDLNSLFKDSILPICFAYGKDYVSAAVVLQSAYKESIKLLEEKTIENLRSYLLAYYVSQCNLLIKTSRFYSLVAIQRKV